MSDAFWTAFWTALPPTIVAFAALIQSRRTHKEFNSKMDKFLALTATAAHAEGVKEGEDKVEAAQYPQQYAAQYPDGSSTHPQ